MDEREIIARLRGALILLRTAHLSRWTAAGCGVLAIENLVADLEKELVQK